MRFKKRQINKESYKVIMFDLGCLVPRTEDEKYHYKLLKGNLNDIFGMED